MRVSANKQQLCPCYEECQEFQKLVELKDSGLVVYCHRPRKEDIRRAEAVESAVNTSRDVFILYNKKEVKIKTSELSSEIETKNISCPRCRKTFEHAQKLMQEVKSIDRKIVMGICDHCRKKAQTIKKPVCACEEIVKKFINVNGEQKEDIKKYVKIWLSKMGHLLKDNVTLKKPKQIETRAYFDLQINRGLNSPASRHEPEIQQMFYSGTHTSDINLSTEMRETNLKEGHMKQSVAFFQPIEHVETTFSHAPHESEKINAIPSTLLEDSDTTLAKTYVKELPKTALKDRKLEEVFEDIPSIDAKEALKRRHDLSLRQMMRLEKDSRVPNFVSKRPDIYETPKITPWVQKNPTAKYQVESEMTIIMPTLKQDHLPRETRDLDNESNREVKFRSTRPLQDSYYEPKIGDKYHHDRVNQGLHDSEEGQKTVKKLEDHYITDEELKLQRSVDKISHKPKKPYQHVTKSKSWHKKALEPEESIGFDLKPEYSFFFPKVTKKEEQPVRVDVSSAHLIKDIQEKFRLQSESDMKRREEERQQKLERDQKKKLAQEEIKQQDEEKKRQAVEDKKYAEDQKRQAVEDNKYAEDQKRDAVEDKKYAEDQKRQAVEDKKIVEDQKREAVEDRKYVKDQKKEAFEDKKYAEDQKRQAVEDKKIVEDQKREAVEDRKYLKDQKKEAFEDKKYAEDQKRQAVEDKKYVKDKKREAVEDKKYAEDQKIQDVGDKKYAEDQKRQQDKAKRDKTKEDTFDKDGEFEQKGKISKVSGIAKKEKKSEPDRIDEKLDKAKKGTKSKADQGDQIAELLQKDKKHLKSKPEKEDKIAELLQKIKKDLKSKPEREDKIAELLQKAKKDLKSKPENEDKIAELLQKTKKDLKSKPEKTKIDVKGKSELKEKGDDEIIDKGKKDLKEKPTQKSKDEDLLSKLMKDQKKRKMRDKDDETTEKDKKDLKEKPELIKKGTKDLKSGIEQKDKISVPKKDLKAKSQQNDKVVEKEQNTKTEKELQYEKIKREQEDKDHKERLKQIEQLRKEKETPKQQAGKERERLSKETKSTKKKRDSSAEIKVSMSKIQKSINKGRKDESANKQENFVKYKEEKKEKEGKQKELKVKQSKQELEFRKLQALHLKGKEEALNKKKQQEYEAKVALIKAQEEAALKAKQTVELKLADINFQKSGFFENDLILKLVRIKQAAKLKPSEIDSGLIKEHICHHERSRALCPLCLDSELELDVLSLDKKINLQKEIITDIVIGEKIFKIKCRLEKTKEPEVDRILYRKIFFPDSDLPPKEIVQLILQETEPVQKKKMSKKDAKEIDMEPGKGILRYALSDRSFIDKGWTMLPTEKVVRKMNVYRMRPAHPEFDWFEHNKNKRLMTYDTGERLAEFDDNGRGRWYYRSGRLALDYYDAEETNAQQRFVIYSSGEPDERGRSHPITILATFDYLGNGIVFDHTGKIRLKYNQTEGVVLDRGIGPVSHWKWHTLNDPPVLQQVMIDTQMAHKDPYILKLGPAADRATRPDNEEMLAIEFDNFIKEKSKKLSQKFKPFQIKMKALKINEHFSLKVLDQATVYLIFRDGSTNLKLNIGMILDHQEIVDTDTAEVGEVSNSLERFPARTDSLAGLQRSVAHAQRYERQQIERERRLRPAEPCASADQLVAAASPPLRLPFRTVPTASSTSTGYCSRKPTNNLYYNTRLL